MRNDNPLFFLFILSIWIGVAVWSALDGVPGILILLVVYIASLMLPFGIVWLWKKIKNRKPN
jgi:hypothetical protein